MRHQRKSYWCGVAAIANALEVLGIKRSQREIAKLCHVTAADGTNETEMKRALLANGCGVDEWHESNATESAYWVRHGLSVGWPAILCADSDEHWVTVIGVCGERFLVFDPSRNSGIEVHSAESLAARWVNADGIYYGLGVSLP